MNGNIAIIIPITKLDTYIVIVQQDATKHAINRLQMKRFIEANVYNIILFPTGHSRIRKDGRNIIGDAKLAVTNLSQKKDTIGPGLLFYH